MGAARMRHWVVLLLGVIFGSAVYFCPAAVDQDTRFTSCTIDRVSKISARDFRTYFESKQRPVVISGYESSNAAFRELTSRDNISVHYGDLKVKLGSAHQFTRPKQSATLDMYLAAMKPFTEETRAESAMYLFGEHLGAQWDEFLNKYRQPELTDPRDNPHGSTLSFGIGDSMSGVPFHFHGHGFQEALHGRKRWYLFPPDTPNEVYNSNMTQLQWVNSVLPKLPHRQKPLECTVHPGEIIYFPAKWMHGILNLDSWTVFISTFL